MFFSELLSAFSLFLSLLFLLSFLFLSSLKKELGGRGKEGNLKEAEQC